jgi:hypothetical protein
MFRRIIQFSQIIDPIPGTGLLSTPKNACDPVFLIIEHLEGSGSPTNGTEFTV